MNYPFTGNPNFPPSLNAPNARTLNELLNLSFLGECFTVAVAAPAAIAADDDDDDDYDDDDGYGGGVDDALLLMLITIYLEFCCCSCRKKAFTLKNVWAVNR